MQHCRHGVSKNPVLKETSQGDLLTGHLHAPAPGAWEREAPAFTAARPRSAWRARPQRRRPAQALAVEVAEASNNNNSNHAGTVVVAPRSPFVTGSSDLSTPGPISPLVTRPLESEKTVVFLRHGQTTWNLEKRIQVRVAAGAPLSPCLL